MVKSIYKVTLQNNKPKGRMKMKKRLLSVLLSVLMVAAMLVGCGTGSAEPQEEKTEEKVEKEKVEQTSDEGEGVKIAFVISDLSNEVWIELLNACQVRADEIGAEFTFEEAQEVEQKITAIENLTNAGYDVIISHVSDPDAMQPVISAAQEKGIKFIAYDTDTETSDAFFGNDETVLGRKIGSLAAKWINETFDSSETVKVGLANYPEFNFLVIRENGIRAALEEEAPNAEVVVAQQAGYVPEGVEVGEVWMQSAQDLDCVIGINDSGILGIYQSFIAAGVDPKDEKLGFFGCDGTGEALKLISEDGIYRGSISVNMIEAAAPFIDTSVKLAKGEEVEHDFFFRLEDITLENVAEKMQ